jgi:SAM-dependent methyltransferase
MAALDFSRRSDFAELMDSDETDDETLRACLVDLAKVNRLTLAYRPTLRFLDGLVRARRWPCDRAVTVVDIGSGFGDMLRVIDRWAQRRRLMVDLVGVDRNPASARAAQAATAAGRPIRYVTASVFDYAPAEEVDVVISSLFTHHLNDVAVVRFLSWMEAHAAIGWFINDLHRHAVPYHVFRVLARAMRFHRFVQHDGPVSIARAFDRSDWSVFLEAAGVPRGAATVTWHVPFRLCVARCMDPRCTDQ